MADEAIDAELRAEVSGGRVARNTVANGADRMVGAVLAVVLTPFLLDRLGADEYGIWVLATTLTLSSGYLSLAELGLQQASVRSIAAARSRGDREEVSHVVSVTLYFYLALGTCLALALAGLSGTLSHVFNVGANYQTTATIVFMLVGVQIALDLPGAALLAVVEGAQRYGVLRTIDLVGRLVWAGLTVLLVSQGHGVVSLAVVSLVIAAGNVVAAAVFARRTEPSLRLRPRFVTRASLSSTLTGSSSMMALRVLGVIYSQMDRTIIGIALTTTAVASYEVAFKIQSLAAVLLGVAPSAVMPAASYLSARRDTERLRTLYLQGTRYAVGLCVPLCVAGAIYAGAIVTTWVGTGFEDSIPAARLFLVFPALAIALVVGQTMLIGLGRMRRLLVFHVAAVGLNLVLSVALVHTFGVTGVIWGTVAAYIVLWVPFTRLFFAEFDVDLGSWARHVVLPVLPAIILQTVVGIATLAWVDQFDRLWQVGVVFLCNYAIAVAVFIALIGRDEFARLRARLLHRSMPSTAT